MRPRRDSAVASHPYGFYQQTYCGCIYSLAAERLPRVTDGNPEDGPAQPCR
ncbi:epoxyqueuosine reductase QueH [Thiocapsa sp.]|uniref:epoxyqueuosine reductase QueH n=1 Tax=Thiocapsa sp. TaxID=2024551 RepID=UPI0035941823